MPRVKKTKTKAKAKAKAKSVNVVVKVKMPPMPPMTQIPNAYTNRPNVATFTPSIAPQEISLLRARTENEIRRIESEAQKTLASIGNEYLSRANVMKTPRELGLLSQGEREVQAHSIAVGDGEGMEEVRRGWRDWEELQAKPRVETREIGTDPRGSGRPKKAEMRNISTSAGRAEEGTDTSGAEAFTPRGGLVRPRTVRGKKVYDEPMFSQGESGVEV